MDQAGNKGNKGFTLIELIISIAILAIITAPFLNAFVIASKNNAQASVKQKATNYTESLMEKFKAASFEMLTDPTGGEFTLVDVGALDAYENDKVYYYDNANNSYVFRIPGSDLSGNPNSSYQAEVSMTPVDYDAPDLNDINGATAAILISEIYQGDGAAINNLYAQLDGIPDGKKADAYRVHSHSAADINAAIQRNTVRTAFVNIIYDASLGTRPFQVSLTVAYECSYGPSGSSDSVSYVYDDVFSNTYEDVPDVLMFYTLYPYGQLNCQAKDQIVIDNQIPDDIMTASGKKSKVYIANQEVRLQNTGRYLKYNANSAGNSNIVFKKNGTIQQAIASDPAAPTKFENDNIEVYMANGIYDGIGIYSGQINTLVGIKESIQLYKLNVKIYWNGVLQSSVDSATDVQN